MHQLVFMVRVFSAFFMFLPFFLFRFVCCSLARRAWAYICDGIHFCFGCSIPKCVCELVYFEIYYQEFQFQSAAIVFLYYLWVCFCWRNSITCQACAMRWRCWWVWEKTLCVYIYIYSIFVCSYINILWI